MLQAVVGLLIFAQLRVKEWKVDMHQQWVAMEHYRLHMVEEWSDSPYKKATLAGIQSTLASLLREAGVATSQQQCAICMTRKRTSKVLEFPSTAPLAAECANVAA